MAIIVFHGGARYVAIAGRIQVDAASVVIAGIDARYDTIAARNQSDGHIVFAGSDISNIAVQDIF